MSSLQVCKIVYVCKIVFGRCGFHGFFFAWLSEWMNSGFSSVACFCPIIFVVVVVVVVVVVRDTSSTKIFSQTT